MRMSWTLSRYFGLHLLAGIGVVFGIFLTLILLGNVIELMRRAASIAELPFSSILSMALLQLPWLSERAMPFAVLFGALWTFLRLGRNHELVVTRASGVSVWQILTPCVGFTLLLGVFAAGVYNPLSASMVSQFEQLEAKHLRGKASLLAVSSSGLWLRQADPLGQSVIHALRASGQGTSLQDVIIFLYEGTDKFTGRIDASRAWLRQGFWEIEEATLTGPDKMLDYRARYLLPTSLTRERIQESFASPETLSFWNLPAFIKVLEEAGFSAVRHRLHWHAITAAPLMLCAMVLIAANFAMRAQARSGTGLAVTGTLLTGFVLFFITDLSLALGSSGSLPAILAAWLPSGVSVLLGVSMLLHFEDG